MKIVLVLTCFLDIEENVEFKMSVLISPSKTGPRFRPSRENHI